MAEPGPHAPRRALAGAGPDAGRGDLRIIREIHAGGTTVLLVEQNANKALSIADYGYVLETGRSPWPATASSSCVTTTCASRIWDSDDAQERRTVMKTVYRSCSGAGSLIVLLLVSSPAAWAEDGVTDKEVVVGAGLDLTGAVANWGVNIKAGMEAVFNRVNEAGGVHGRKIRLIAYDHVYQPPKAVANAKRLVERDKVFIMMGHLGTPTTKAIKDYLEEKQRPQHLPRHPGQPVGHLRQVARRRSGHVRRSDLADRRLPGEGAQDHQDCQLLPGRRVRSRRPPGWQGAPASTYELDYIAEVDYKRADIDFSSQAAKLKESGAEAVILQAVYREPPRLAEQCHAIGYNPLFIGPSPIVLDKTIELGGKHVEGIIGVEVYPLPTDPGPFLDQYRADMQKYFPNLPLDTTNLYGYQKAALFVEALQRTGRDLTRDSLLQGHHYHQRLGSWLGPEVQLWRR